jgi:hypothetical protein
MGARFPRDWRERSESEQTIKGKVSVDDESSAMFRKLFPRAAAAGSDGETEEPVG